MQEYQIIEVNNINESANKQDSIRMLNLDTSSYRFSDIDLDTAVKRLPSRDREILILYLMGHNQNDIAAVFNINRSMISRELTKITKNLAILMRGSSA